MYDQINMRYISRGISIPNLVYIMLYFFMLCAIHVCMGDDNWDSSSLSVIRVSFLCSMTESIIILRSFVVQYTIYHSMVRTSRESTIIQYYIGRSDIYEKVRYGIPSKMK